MGFESPQGLMPGISAFEKLEGGSIVRRGYSFFGPGDAYCAVFHFLEFFPSKSE